MTSALQMTINRDILQNEFRWLRRSYKKGESVFLYTGNTNGCMGDGLPCSMTGLIPSFELPSLLLTISHNGKEYSIFQVEQMGAIFEIYARSGDNSAIKITAFKQKISIMEINPKDIPAPF